MSFLPIFIGLTLAFASLIENNDAFTLFPSSTISGFGRKSRVLSKCLQGLKMNGKVEVPGRPTWQQTMVRISDPEKSILFYRNLGMTLIDKFDFPQYGFSLYFMMTLPENEEYGLIPGTQEAHDYLWSTEGVAIELTHNHGTENKKFRYHPGNAGNDGFGHLAVSCDDVYASVKKMETTGVEFSKKPDEGRMKGLAFALDPDGYSIEIVKRATSLLQQDFVFSQTMLRVKDPKKSVNFYRSLGMKLINEKHFDNFSLYFMASNIDREQEDTFFEPVLELTHNHGTENKPEFEYLNGNEEGRQGFGHIGFLVDDVYNACDSIREMGYGFKKEPDGGSMKGLAFAYDPDGYSVEIIKRGGIDFGDVMVHPEKS